MQNGRGRDIDAVEQIDRQRRDVLKDEAVVGEIEVLRPEIAAHRVGQRLDRHDQHPGERQQDDEIEQVDHDVAKRRGSDRRGGLVSESR